MRRPAPKAEAPVQKAEAHAAPRVDLGSELPFYVRAMASRGVAGASDPLPHGDRIQRAFGAHDVSHVRAAVGGAGGEAAAAIGARGYAMGDRIAFGREPDVRLAAHEAAHVVQQQAGLKLPDGVGHAQDEHEQTADAVADAVVDGRSAEPLLDRIAPHAPSGPRAPVADAPVQRFPFWAHTQHPDQPAYPHPPPLPDCPPELRQALDQEVVELKGTGVFTPTAKIAAALKCYSPLYMPVHVQFGTLGHGTIDVADLDGAGTYQTPAMPQWIDLTHPLLPGNGADYPPRAKILIDAGTVTGAVMFSPGEWRIHEIGDDAWLAGANDIPKMLGWEGIEYFGGTPVNDISGGVLRYGWDPFRFRLKDPDAPHKGMPGIASYVVTDEKEQYVGKAILKAEGIATTEMPLHKKGGAFGGSAKVALAFGPKQVDAFKGAFSGSVDASYERGALVILGSATYKGERASGSLTMMVAPQALAWGKVGARLANAPTPPPSNAVMTANDKYVVVGWGSVHFPVNKYIDGEVSAVVDPDGYITADGTLRTTQAFTFLEGKDEREPTVLFHTDKSVPVVDYLFASIDAGYFATVKADGQVGPLTIHDIVLKGAFSSRPPRRFKGSATGRVNLDAWGELTGELGGTLEVKFAHIKSVASAELAGTIKATVKANVELAPTISVDSDPRDPGDARLSFHADVNANAQASLGLSGALTFHGFIFWIPKVSLGSYEWPIGSLDLASSFDYSIGDAEPDKKHPAATMKPGSLDDGSFKSLMGPLSSRNKKGAPKSSGDHDNEQVEQDASTLPDEVAQPTAVKPVSFLMNGASHTLEVKQEPNAVIHMHSDGDKKLDDALDAKIESLEEEAVAEMGDDRADVKAEEKVFRSALGQSENVESALDVQKSESDPITVQGLQQVADTISAGAAQTGDTDLAPVIETPAIETPAPEADPEAKEEDDDEDEPEAPRALKPPVDGRYVIEDAQDLALVKAHWETVILPNPDAEALGPLAEKWDLYTKYVPERLREFERAFGPPKPKKPKKQGAPGAKKPKKKAAKKKKLDGPQTWFAYRRETKFDDLRAAKAFQPALRTSILNDPSRAGLDPTKAEIDVGVSPTRRGGKFGKGPFYADLVILPKGPPDGRRQADAADRGVQPQGPQREAEARRRTRAPANDALRRRARASGEGKRDQMDPRDHANGRDGSRREVRLRDLVPAPEVLDAGRHAPRPEGAVYQERVRG
ncbi:MAG TPA: DUF4157 domain-containing protein [Kofleriaceae bacterium]|jgi:hypothetical protein